MRVLLLLILLMEPAFIQLTQHNIRHKQYLVPTFNLDGFEQFLLPKIDIKGMQDVYYGPTDINQLYKDNNIDPEELQCNLKYTPQQHNTPPYQHHKLPHQHNKPQESRRKQEEKQEIGGKQEGGDQLIKQNSKSQRKGQQKQQHESSLANNKRPALRQKGYTHFIHVPFVDLCREAFQSVVKTQIDPNDLDALVAVQTLHVTLMVLRVNSLEDIPKWQKIVRSLKLRKAKVNIRGVGIFPVKPNTNFTRVLYAKVQGLEEIIDDLVSKAIAQELVTQKELSNIAFDKKTDSYKMEQQHLTLLKTQGKDIIDATQYLKAFAKLNLGRTGVSEVSMSMIGSFDGQGYFDQFTVSANN